jgi:hypothetical protein
MEHPYRTSFDVALGTTAATSPIWVQYIQTGATVVAAIGGATLVLIRVWIAIKDLRRNGK